MTALGPGSVVVFVGIGNMGAPMAGNLRRAGYDVIAIDADVAKAAGWAATHGARHVELERLSEIADEVDAVVTMLPSGVEVRSVLTEPGFLAGVRRGIVAIDMSSADPVGTRTLGAELEAHGVRLVDAPVSGGVPRATAATLAIMIGGEPDAVEMARPILQAMGDRLFDVGALGNGHAMKCLNNLVAGSAFAVCSEALAVGARFGLDPTVMFDVMNASTARCFNTESVMKQHVVSGEYASGFALGLLAKDVGIATSLAAAMGSTTPVADAVIERLAAARDALGFGVDHTRAHEFWHPRADSAWHYPRGT